MTLETLAPHSPCPTCTVASAAAKGTLSTLVRYLDEPEVRAAFAAGSGLCLTHYKLVLHLVRRDRDRGEVLVSLQGERMRFLVGELREYLRKKSYEYSREPKGPEVDAWRSALEMLVSPQGK